MSDPFASAVARAFAALTPPSRVLVAVSGGADSVALLEALHRGLRRRALAPVALVVGHVDHRLRADSAVDARLVARHADRLGLAYAEAALALGDRRNLEERAREARYAALQALAAAHGCEAIATAHTATDQAETLLWRLARGAGGRGLGGMAPRRRLGGLLLVRPMLALTREDARAFCGRAGLAFVDDPTNVDERPRARLRAEVLPVLERLVPGAVRHLAAATARLREDESVLAGLAEPPARAADLAVLAALPPAVRRRALAAWVEHATGSRRRLTSRHLEALEQLVLSRRGEVELPASAMTRCVAVLSGSHLSLDVRPRAGPVTDAG